jgi:hypothetical protein
MQTWTRSLVGAILGGGATAAAYLLLSPSIWTRDDLGSLQFASAFAAAGCFRVAGAKAHEQTPRGHLPTWLVHTAAMAICLTAGFVVVAVLGALVSGDDMLTTPGQVVAFAIASAVVVGFVIGTSRRWGFGRRARELERQTRIAGIRAQARRDIDELAAGARDAESGGRRDHSSPPSS